MTSGLVMGILAALCLAMFLRGLTSCTVKPVTSVTINTSAAAVGTGTSTLSPNSRNDVSSITGTALTFGTGANQINLVVNEDRQLAASGSETLDLYGHTTPLQDPYGNNCLFLHIKYIEIHILPGQGDITGLTIGGAGSNPWVAGGALGGTAPTMTIYPNGCSFQLGEPTAGLVVSATSGQLKITNNSSSVSCNYRLVIGGTTT